MQGPVYFSNYDVGTTGIKTCFFAVVTDKYKLINAKMASCHLYVLDRR